MSLKKLFLVFFSFLFVLKFSAQRTSSTSQPLPKGKLIINQDAEISAIVNNKKTSTTSMPSSFAKTKPSDKPVHPTEKTPQSSTYTRDSSKEIESRKSSIQQGREAHTTSTLSQEKKVDSKSSSEQEMNKETIEENERSTRSRLIRTRYKARGFRIQIYTGGNTRKHRTEAYAIGNKVREVVPELGTYVQFQSPHWICRVGDFRNREDASRYARRLHSAGIAKETRVVSCDVLLTY